MKSLMDDVAQFMRACDQPVLDKPTVPMEDRQFLRHELVTEEFYEFEEALLKSDLPALADAIADLIYVLVGTAHEYGIPLGKVWDEVSAANIRKVDSATGKVIKNAAGKVMKPEGWTPPDIDRVLSEAS